ncbi:MAG: hypothetical protein JXC85_04180 [Candidatus Aenigmarchaeota archaeon]|nr:hypothetical protein [Candidatus Aenigmarchaeota archaeon]
MRMKNREIIMSGILTGISGLFARMAMMDTGWDLSSMQAVISNPHFVLACLFGIGGFAYLQLALHKGDLSFVQPAVSSIAIITPIVLAVILLREFVPAIRWVGVGLLLIGVIGIEKGEKDSLLGVIARRLRRTVA